MKADATIQATIWAYTNGPEEIFFQWPFRCERELSMLPQFGHNRFSAKFDPLGVASSFEGASAVSNAV